jgi:hypothetical protein
MLRVMMAINAVEHIDRHADVMENLPRSTAPKQK